MDYRLRMALDPDLKIFCSFVKEGDQGPLWGEQEQRLRELNEAVSRRGGIVLVATFPFSHAMGDEYPFAQIHGQMDDLWHTLEVPLLDLLDTFRPYPA